jgi:hypothetical protein
LTASIKLYNSSLRIKKLFGTFSLRLYGFTIGVSCAPFPCGIKALFFGAGCGVGLPESALSMSVGSPTGPDGFVDPDIKTARGGLREYLFAWLVFAVCIFHFLSIKCSSKNQHKLFMCV